jgi:CheY-like chemotaxis protein
VALELLVVEDDADVRTTLVESLRDEGYQVREAEHGQHALDLLAGEWRPQIILLDVMMPVMDGMTFLHMKQLDEQLVHIPVVVVSATAEPPIPGALCVLRKPVEWEQLLLVIAEHAKP